jgi:hypothetical protein
MWRIYVIIIIISLLMSAGAQVYLMDYPHGERAITHHAGPCGLVGANGCKYSRDQRVNVPYEARRSSI